MVAAPPRSSARDEEDVISETPLDDVAGWTDEYSGRLREVWITSVEQFVALAATTGGITAIAQQLQISEDRARQLVVNARTVLAPGALHDLDRPVDTSEYGLGVLPPGTEEGLQDES
jgi:hypothetical protein